MQLNFPVIVSSAVVLAAAAAAAAESEVIPQAVPAVPGKNVAVAAAWDEIPTLVTTLKEQQLQQKKEEEEQQYFPLRGNKVDENAEQEPLLRGSDHNLHHDFDNVVIPTTDDADSLERDLQSLLLKNDDEDVSLFGSSSDSNNCADQTTCQNCTRHSRMCHWCAHDNACHARGSYYGCAWGISCGGNDDNDNGKKKDDDKTSDDKHCKSHKNCSACASSSRFCHWCAKDNACHAVGSVYGCLSGVDCYSNDRCQRKDSEPISETTIEPPPMGPFGKLALAVVWAISILLAMCATVCFCCVVRAKGEYEDLIASSDLDHDEERRYGDNAAAGNGNEDNHQHHPEADLSTPLLSSQKNHVPDSSDEAEVPEENRAPEMAKKDPPTGDGQVSGDDHDQVVDLEEQQPQPHSPRPHHSLCPPNPTMQKRRRKFQCLYILCSFCYVLTLAVVAAMAFGSYRYYPKMVEYNICNDSVAWKKLVENMAKMKATADIEILASVANYNPIDVTVVKGGGNFYHDGDKLVGTFDIPPDTVAKANSITDVLIVAHFAPEKWQALKIGEEYYQGRLVLNVNALGRLRVPALWNYTFDAKLQNITVHVNEINGRKLCHCPSWNQPNQY